MLRKHITFIIRIKLQAIVFKKSFSTDLIRFEILANFVQMHLFTEKVYYK